jgi:hypothetical protein
LNFENHPELEALLAEDENISVLSYLNAEANLLRWFNYQLKKAGYVQVVKNFSDNISVKNLLLKIFIFLGFYCLHLSFASNCARAYRFSCA